MWFGWRFIWFNSVDLFALLTMIIWVSCFVWWFVLLWKFFVCSVGCVCYGVWLLLYVVCVFVVWGWLFCCVICGDF